MRSPRQREPQVLEPRDLRLGEALAGARPRAPVRATARAPGAASPPPPPARRARAPRARARSSSSKRSASSAPGRRAQRVAAALRDARRPRPAALRSRDASDLDGLPRVLAGRRRPTARRRPGRRGRRAAVHQQQREERERASARHAGAPALRDVDLDRPEDPELAPPRRELSPGREADMKPRAGSVRPCPLRPPARPAPTAPRQRTPWGMLAAIDLHGCDVARLADPDSIRRFVPAVIDAIGMRAHGPLLARALRRRRARGLVGDAVHRDQLDHDPRRRGRGAVASSTCSRAGRSTPRSRPRSPSRTSAARRR